MSVATISRLTLQTLSSIIEAGGDTDTNGAVAGARFGREAIPRRVA